MATCSCRPSRNIRGTISSTPTPTMLFEQFKMAETACKKYLDAGWSTEGNAKHHLMALPAYDQCIKASHVFNLLDARGVISVTERQSYILRVRELAKACGEAWLATEAGGGGMSEQTAGDRRHRADRRRRGRGRELLVVPLRPLQEPAVLRRLARGHRLRAAGMEGRALAPDELLHLQAHQVAAVLRRQPRRAVSGAASSRV